MNVYEQRYLQETVRTSLDPLENQISLALVYGSIAKQSDTAKSDVDLLVVSDNLTLEDLYSHLEKAEKSLGRRVNPTLYTQVEFSRKKKSSNAFLKRVLDGPTIVLMGTLDAA